MAEAVAFRAALGRCGFDNAACDFLVTQGFDTAETFAAGIPDGRDATKDFVKNLSRQQLPAGVILPWVNLLKLRAFRAFLGYKAARGEALVAGEFTDVGAVDQIAKWQKRVSELDAAKERDDKQEKAAELSRWSGWESFEESTTAFFKTYRNPTTGVTLDYLMRENDDVTADMLDEEYATIDDDLVTTTELDGDQYHLDNQRFWDLLKSLLINGPAWSHAKRFKSTRDGRSAWISIKAQAMGQAANQNRKDEAYKMMANAEYTGRGTFTFQHYIDRWVRAQNTLTELNEQVPDTKLCTDFLEGIKDPALEETVKRYWGDANLRNDFTLLQQQILAVASKIKPTGRGRGIGAVATGRGRGGRGGGRGGRGGGRGGGGRGKGDQAKKEKPRIRPGHYILDEWEDLEEEERQQVYKLREEKKRKAAAVETEESTKKKKKKKISAVTTKKAVPAGAAPAKAAAAAKDVVPAGTAPAKAAAAAKVDEKVPPAAAVEVPAVAAAVAEAPKAVTFTESNFCLSDAEAADAEENENDEGFEIVKKPKKKKAKSSGRRAIFTAAAVENAKAAITAEATNPNPKKLEETVLKNAKDLIDAEAGKGNAGNQFGRFAHSSAATLKQAPPSKEVVSGNKKD